MSWLLICTNSKTVTTFQRCLSTSYWFLSGAWESPEWMHGRLVWKGFCDQPPYVSPAVQVTVVTSWSWTVLLLSAVLIWATRCGFPACSGAWWLRSWWGPGNAQVTVNEGDCFFVYQISHHIVNSEPIAQPKPPVQLPNYGDFRLQKQVCKKSRQKNPSPLPSPVLPSPTECGTLEEVLGGRYMMVRCLRAMSSS